MLRPRPLAMAGALLLLLAVGGRLLSGHYRLRPWLDHPVAFGIAGSALLAVAALIGIRRPAIRWAVIALFTLAGVLVAALAWFLAPFNRDLIELSRYPAPDGSAELVVLEGYNWIDPFWELRLRTNGGLLSREHGIGCVNGDFTGLEKVQWTGPQTLRVESSDGRVTEIQVTDGRPDRLVDGGC